MNDPIGMDKSSTENIQFQALFSKVTSTVDGGWNLTLSLDQSQVLQIAQISVLRDTVLNVTIEPITDG